MVDLGGAVGIVVGVFRLIAAWLRGWRARNQFL